MGDIAELMISGVLCERCNRVIEGEASEHVRICRDCRDADQQAVRDAGGQRLRLWFHQFEHARLKASQHDLRLIRRTDEHYQLEHVDQKWLVNLYPRSGRRRPRVFPDKYRPKGPYLVLREGWGLSEAVNAAIRATKEKSK